MLQASDVMTETLICARIPTTVINSLAMHHGLSNRTTPLIFLGLLLLASALVVPFANAQTVVVATVTVGSQPYAAAYDSAKGEVFVANALSNTVAVISDSRNAVVSTVTVGSAPGAVAYDSAKGEVFVSN